MGEWYAWKRENRRSHERKKESLPVEDGIRICYLREACEEVKEALIGMVQCMFKERMHKWNEWLKSGVMCFCLRRVIGK